MVEATVVDRVGEFMARFGAARCLWQAGLFELWSVADVPHGPSVRILIQREREDEGGGFEAWRVVTESNSLDATEATIRAALED